MTVMIVMDRNECSGSNSPALKEAFPICEVTNNLINLKNKKDILRKELRLQLSNVINICTESFTFLGIPNLEGDNIRRQYLSKILPPKLVSFTKDVSKPSEYLLGNDLNDRIGTIETSQKMLQTYLFQYSLLKKN